MREIRHLTAAHARRVPWRNGRGVTEELLLWPPGASFERGDFAWRLSRAAVDEAGPFSAFPGFERILVVTAGAGLLLDHGAAAPPARVEPLQPYRFSGDWPTVAALVRGPVADFNVLARRGAVRADAEVLRIGGGRLEERDLPVTGHAVVHVFAGAVEARWNGAARAAEGGGDGSAGHVTLAERESLWIGGPTPASRASSAPLHTPELAAALSPAGSRIELGGDGVVLLVQLATAPGSGL
jgi:environmental stress-induced protein Ves